MTPLISTLLLAAVVALPLPYERCRGLPTYRATQQCLDQANAEARQHQAAVDAEVQHVLRELRQCHQPAVEPPEV